MPYQFLDHTADIMFIARNKSIEKLFADCGLALMDSMADLKSIGDSFSYEINLDEKKLDNLLFSFLEELVYLKDAEYVLFKDFKIKIVGKYKLKAKCVGGKINVKKNKLKVDVKAVTLHHFYLKKKKEGYEASVLLDI